MNKFRSTNMTRTILAALAAVALAAALPGRLAAAQGCQGDFVPNGVVNGADLAIVLGTWGPCVG